MILLTTRHTYSFSKAWHPQTNFINASMLIIVRVKAQTYLTEL